MSEKPKLNTKDYLDLAVEAGIGSIPYIGSTLQTLYFGSKNEIRLKRLEQFYTDLVKQLESIKNKIPQIENRDRERSQLLGIIESINDEIETAKAQRKKDYYRNLFKNCILKINNVNWDEEEYFVEVLKQLNTVDLQVIEFLNKNKSGDFIGNINSPSVPQELLDGSLIKLTNLGLAQQSIGSIVLGGTQGKQNMMYRMSTLGSNFVSSTFS